MQQIYRESDINQVFIIDSGTASRNRRVLESKLVNQHNRLAYEKSLIPNITLRQLLHNGLQAAIWMLTWEQKIDNKDSFLTHIVQADRIRGIGVILAFLGLTGILILEAM